MAINFRSNTIIKNLRVGPLSGGGGGQAVGNSVSSPYLAVGAPGTNSYAGAAYIYDANNLSATSTKLAAIGLETNDYFGYSITTNSNQIIIAAKFDDDQDNNAGAVYVYDANNLSATPTKLAPSGLDSTDTFGSSVAVYGNHIVVGAFQDDDQGSGAGAVYVYDATNLSATPTKLTPFDGSSNGRFGTSVSLG